MNDTKNDETREMKRLPDTYTKGDYVYQCISRDEDIAIYSQNDKVTGKLYAYEVFIIQKNEAGFRFGKDFEATESVPNSERWGKEAYTVREFDKIPEFIEILQQRLTERVKNQIQRGTVGAKIDDL